MTGAPIHRVFEAIATSSPTSVAITTEYETLTYGELNERAERIARYLRSRGVRQGTYVPLCMKRSAELILGMLGVLRAEGAYVPIDPGYPKERLRFILDEVDSPIVLAAAETVDLLPETGAAVICIDRDWRTIESVQDGFEGEQSGSGGTDPACVVFTSGSTGTPKGVIVPHGGIVDLVVDANYIDLGPSDRIAHISNVGFDAASFEIWGALLNGARLIIIPGRISSEPRELAAELQRHKISVLLLTTALFELLAAWNGAIFGGVRRLLVGGDVVNPKWMRRVLVSGQPPERLLHVYGPTECATFATVYLVTSVPEDAVRIPIGWPISKTTAYVLDGERKPVSIGTPGELCLAGPRLAKGYLNRPELTRDKFVHVLFDNGGSERIYRTGDLVRCLPDGSIEFMGRIDRQLKIRGYRVEPAEIESRLNAHPSIASSVVMARRDPSGQASLVAFFIVQENQPAPFPAELSAHLSVTLPDYMLPSVFVRKWEWPLSAHGKVDHGALLETLRADRDQGETASASASEQALRELCRKVIGKSFLGLDESLIAHGLHSLSAANLAWMIEEEFDVRLKLSEILNKPTIAGVLALLEERQNGNGEIPDPRLEVRTVRPHRIPLSFPQEQIWFLEKLHPHLNSYRFQSLLHCHGALDFGALEATLNQMVSRHEILRTLFVAEDDMPRQEIRPYVAFSLPLEDLRAWPADARQGQLDLLIHEELRRPFDSAAGPLIRWRLFQVDDNEFKLLHTEHHFLHDGWGYGILLGELYAIYKALSEKEDLPWDSSPTQFADFALWQREAMVSGAWDKQLGFWKKELAGCPPPPSLPSDRRMSVWRTFEGRQIRRPFPQAVWEELGRVCSRHGVTRFAWLHAAFQLFIHRYTGAEDFCVGSGFANRRDPRLRGMLGMVINTLPIRARFEGVNSFQELAQRASQALRKASDNQELPFERVVQEINPRREANANPFFNTCVGAYEDVFPHFQSDRLEITSDDALACGQVKFDLMALLVPSKSGCGENSSPKSRAPLVLWEFSTELFDVSTGVQMLDHFLHLAESSVRQPDAPIGRLPLMSRDEEERVLRLGRSPSPPLDDRRVDTVFDRVARSFPDRVAVEWEGGTLSYGELNERASRLARYLRAQGVANGVRVGLCMDRCAEMIIGMLGILKAGGTYVPLDPTYPSERLDFMRKDAEATLILSIERFAESIASLGIKVILLDRDQSLIESFPGEEIPDFSAPNDLAYVIFTSGSTGQPKGVVVSHRAIVRLVVNTNYVSLGPEDRVAHLSNVCFDAATFEIWGALLTGGCIVLIPENRGPRPPSFRR